MTDSPFAPGSPCWADISPTDMAVGRAFYSAVLGWDIPPGNEAFGGYTTASVGDSGAAGFMPNDGSSPTVWTLYFATTDADATSAAIIANGGAVLVPTMQVGDFGSMVIAADPSGAVFGVWQADTMVGFENVGEPGGWAWCDLRSSDPDAARDFYGAVFGFTYTPMDMAGPAYSTFSLGDDAPPLGGIGDMMGAPSGVPSHWLVYFAVTDSDAAAQSARKNGGNVLADPFDTPFGRMAPMTDPFGAPFWTVQLPAS
jgi:predicted enzyme related to lactoylglutathione lyase